MRKLFAMGLISMAVVIGAARAQAQNAAPTPPAHPTPQAGTPTASNPAAQPAPLTPEQIAENSRVVCRKVEQLGSRLRGQRVCRTVAQWRAVSETAGRNTKSIQNQGGFGNPTSNPNGGG
jgi:hypothetical protein